MQHKKFIKQIDHHCERMRNPIDAIVLPNPCWMVFTIVFGGRMAKARKTETRKRAINASSLSFEVRMIIAIILIPTRIED